MILKLLKNLFGGTQSSQPAKTPQSQPQPKPAKPPPANLIEAADCDDLEAALRFLDAGFPAEAADGDGVTPLQHAARRGNVALVEKLLEKGAQVNSASRTGNTPLGNACAENNREVATLLLTHGANPNTTNSAGASPLRMAVFKSDVDEELVSVLLAGGADPSLGGGNGPITNAIDAAELQAECAETGGGISGMLFTFLRAKDPNDKRLTAHARLIPILKRHVGGAVLKNTESTNLPAQTEWSQTTGLDTNEAASRLGVARPGTFSAVLVKWFAGARRPSFPTIEGILTCRICGDSTSFSIDGLGSSATCPGCRSQYSFFTSEKEVDSCPALFVTVSFLSRSSSASPQLPDLTITDIVGS